MTPPYAQPVSVGRPRADAAARAEPTGPFVVNLCSSTTPMALSQPQDPELKRFSFFVSRRLEDGRERFRLHMGYFETLEEAEEWVAVVREFYPGAWAGEAPGKRLRALERPGAVAPRQDLPPQLAIPVLQPAPATSPVEPDPTVLELVEAPIPATAAPAPAPAAAKPAVAAAPTPTARPAPAAQPTSSQPATQPPGSAAAPGAPRGVSKSAAGSSAARAPTPASAAVKSGAAPRPAPVSASPAKPVPAKPGPARPVPAGPVAAKSDASSTARLSNVGEVLASLDDAEATREMPAGAPRAEQPQSERSSLSDSQVLSMLEARHISGKPAAADSSISLLKPDDTSTCRALKEAVASNAPVSFAVQLQWSVQPIDVTKVPPLAIFGAYTLYTVEGSRQGRRWYGLRLGFFSDAISAKQVAYYVRSEFNSVAVVPVSPQERSRAGDTGGGTRAGSPGAGPGDAAKPAAARSPVRDRLPPEPTSEFKLLDDEPKVPPAPEKKAPTAKPRAAAPATKRAAKNPAGRVRAREKRSPQTLEETLEILGADQLEIDDGRVAETSRKGAPPLKVPERKNSPFTKLLDRLAERSSRAR
jgi:hypothetical protein